MSWWVTPNSSAGDSCAFLNCSAVSGCIGCWSMNFGIGRTSPADRNGLRWIRCTCGRAPQKSSVGYCTNVPDVPPKRCGNSAVRISSTNESAIVVSGNGPSREYPSRRNRWASARAVIQLTVAMPVFAFASMIATAAAKSWTFGATTSSIVTPSPGRVRRYPTASPSRSTIRYLSKYSCVFARAQASDCSGRSVQPSIRRVCVRYSRWIADRSFCLALRSRYPPGFLLRVDTVPADVAARRQRRDAQAQITEPIVRRFDEATREAVAPHGRVRAYTCETTDVLHARRQSHSEAQWHDLCQNPTLLLGIESVLF